MIQLEVLLKKATLLPKDETTASTEATQDDENSFLPSTLISLPILTRASYINDKQPQELNTDKLQSEICENSANPQYNFCSKFRYNHIQELCNDLLLSDSSNCNIFLKASKPQKKGKKTSSNDDELFGIIKMEWKQWILSAINNKESTNWIFCLTILDPENNTLKRGEIDLEIIFHSQSTQNENINQENQDKKSDETEGISWQNINFNTLIPEKYSFLIINADNIKSIPNEWFPKMDEKIQHLISISFEVNCSNDYSEKMEMNLSLQTNDENDKEHQTLLLNKEWMFFMDQYGLDYYLNKAQNKESFDIKFDHIIPEKNKKKVIVNTVKDTFCLSMNLRPLTRPGTCKLPQIQYTMDWSIEEDTEIKVTAQSVVEIAIRFKDPLIIPYIKPLPTAADLSIKSVIRNDHLEANKNTTQIESKIKFQAVIASIQEELKNKYLKVCTTYNDMSKQQRKETFMNYLLSSTHGQRLSNIISQIAADVAKEEMYDDDRVTTEELKMKLRAKLDDLCNTVFDDIMSKVNPKTNQQKIDIKANTENMMKPYLQSTNIENVYAEPLRDIDTVKTLIEIALLNQDYENAQKWITQAMAICNDKELYCKLYMELAFVLSQMQSDSPSAYHCINYSLSIKETKEILYAKIVVLCEKDKLEEAEPFMDKLMKKFEDDPYVQTLKGIFEYLMEEVEDAQNIWEAQFDAIQKRKQQAIEDQENKNAIEDEEKTAELKYVFDSVTQQNQEENDETQDANEYDLYDLWIFAVNMALKFDCKQMSKTILRMSEPLFEIDSEYKIDYILLQHHVLIYNKQYEIALSKLGEAILMNDRDTRLWLHIGSTYYLLNKQYDSIEAFERHINECNDQEILPNLMGMIRLIQIGSIDNVYSEPLRDRDKLIKMIWNRIECCQIYNDDNLNILVSFENRDRSFVDALKYKVWTLQAQYFAAINDKTSSLSHYANASSIHPFDEELWTKINEISHRIQYDDDQSATQ